jgi:hypothetical protein
MLMTLALSMSLLLGGSPMSVHDFQAKTIDGKRGDLELQQIPGRPDGQGVGHLDSAVEPTSAEMKRRIEAILPRT